MTDFETLTLHTVKTRDQEPAIFRATLAWFLTDIVNK